MGTGRLGQGGHGHIMSEPAKRRLLTHRTVAAMMDVTTQSLRGWVERGEFPLPHSVIAATMFYEAARVESYIRTGAWPEGTRFHGMTRVAE